MIPKILALPLILLTIVTLSATALGDDSEQGTADTNPSGNWNFSLYESAVSGMCPMGQDGSGTLTILDQGGGALTLQYVTGMQCDPSDVCVLFGACDGNLCAFSTEVTVDDEGGKVTNSAELTLVAPNHLEGVGSSVYQHPQGFTCSWSYMLTLSR